MVSHLQQFLVEKVIDESIQEEQSSQVGITAAPLMRESRYSLKPDVNESQFLDWSSNLFGRAGRISAFGESVSTPATFGRAIGVSAFGESVSAIGTFGIGRGIFEIPRMKSVSRYIKPLTNERLQIKGIDEVISLLSDKLTIVNNHDLRKFMMKTAINLDIGFIKKLEKVVQDIHRYFKDKNIDVMGCLELSKDEEIEDFESLSIRFLIKNADSDKCIELTEKLVSDIAEKDDDILRFLQIEVLPDER